VGSPAFDQLHFFGRDGVILGGGECSVKRRTYPLHASRKVVLHQGAVVGHALGTCGLAHRQGDIVPATGGEFHSRHGPTFTSVRITITKTKK